MRPSGPGTKEELGQYLDSAEAIALSDPLTFQSSKNQHRKDKGPFLFQTRKRLESLLPLARQLDQGKGSSYEAVVEEQIESILNPAQLPSSRLMKASRASGKDWTGFGLQVATSELKGEEYALEYSRI